MYTVIELNQILKEGIESQFYDTFKITGELKEKKISGNHAYCTLGDESSTIKLNIFNYLRILPNDIKIGDMVEVVAKVNFYEKQASLSIVAFSIKRKDEIGDNLLKKQKLIEELKSLNYFEPKGKILDKHIKYLGVVTSKNGAAISDILKTIRLRNENVEIFLYDAKVQGQNAHLSIAKGIQELSKIDIIQAIVVGRGGGSREDLKAFDEKEVADAIFNSKKFIVSAIGHEIDQSIADMVADLSVSTPTQAIERIIFDKESILNWMQSINQKLNSRVDNKIYQEKLKYENMLLKVNKYEPNNIIKQMNLEYERLYNKVENKVKNILNFKKNLYEKYEMKIQKYSITDILNKGFSYLTDENGKVIKSVKDIQKNKLIISNLIDGKIVSKVEEINEKN